MVAKDILRIAAADSCKRKCWHTALGITKAPPTSSWSHSQILCPPENIKTWVQLENIRITAARIRLQGWRNFWNKKTRKRSSTEDATTMIGICWERLRSRLAASSSSGNTWPMPRWTTCLVITFFAARWTCYLRGCSFCRRPVTQIGKRSIRFETPWTRIIVAFSRRTRDHLI